MTATNATCFFNYNGRIILKRVATNTNIAKAIPKNSLENSNFLRSCESLPNTKIS